MDNRGEGDEFEVKHEVELLQVSKSPILAAPGFVQVVAKGVAPYGGEQKPERHRLHRARHLVGIWIRYEAVCRRFGSGISRSGRRGRCRVDSKLKS